MKPRLPAGQITFAGRFIPKERPPTSAVQNLCSPWAPPPKLKQPWRPKRIWKKRQGY